MSKVMLINLPIQSYFQKDFIKSHSYNPSLGLLYLGTWLELHGYEPIIIDLCYDKFKLNQLLDRIGEQEPLLVGISTYTENIELGISLAKAVKSRFPMLKTLLGGAHVSLVPEDGISSEFVDFVIRKEGESTILELMEAISSHETRIRYDDIPGLHFKRDGKVVNNKLRVPLSDLELLPLPKRELGDIERYEGNICISTSRGCPGKCIYCAATALSGASYRVRDIDNVFLEMVLIKACLKDKDFQIDIIDDTFTAVPGRVLRFVELLEKYDMRIPWQCESRIDAMNEDMIRKMVSSGCIAIQYGIESGCQEVLDGIRKGLNLDHAREVIDFTYNNGAIVILSFMLGHYCDTPDTMNKTIEFIKEMFIMYKPEIALAYNTPFPGTWQYTHADEIGLVLTTRNYTKYSLCEPIVETKNFTLNNQREMFMKARPYMAYHTSLNLLERSIHGNEK